MRSTRQAHRAGDPRRVLGDHRGALSREDRNVGLEVLSLPEDVRPQILGGETLDSVLALPEAERAEATGRAVIDPIERTIMLQIVDGQWKDHLYSLDHLKEGIGLRGYGSGIRSSNTRRRASPCSRRCGSASTRKSCATCGACGPWFPTTGCPRLAVRPRRGGGARRDRVARCGARVRRGVQGRRGRRACARARGRRRCRHQDRASRRAEVGRNDPCPCGSGKKYKKCHGAQ